MRARSDANREGEPTPPALLGRAAGSSRAPGAPPAAYRGMSRRGARRHASGRDDSDMPGERRGIRREGDTDGGAALGGTEWDGEAFGEATEGEIRHPSCGRDQEGGSMKRQVIR